MAEETLDNVLANAPQKLALSAQVRGEAKAETWMPIMDVQQNMMRRQILREMIDVGVLTLGVDYGTIPGVSKPTLLKPGAELLIATFGLSPSFRIEAKIEEWTSERFGQPLFFYRYSCELSRNGVVVGMGIGSSNSWDRKYRARWVPAHAVPANLDKNTLEKRGGITWEAKWRIDKAQTTGPYAKPQQYWDAFKTASENGTLKTEMRDNPRKPGEKDVWWGVEATEYLVPNTEIFEVINTIDKMAQKRALIAAALIAVGGSGFFTQDVEDMPDFSDAIEGVVVKPPPQTGTGQVHPPVESEMDQRPPAEKASAPPPPQKKADAGKKAESKGDGKVEITNWGTAKMAVTNSGLSQEAKRALIKEIDARKAANETLEDVKAYVEKSIGVQPAAEEGVTE